MKFYILFFILVSCLTFSQKNNTIEEVDSVSYYSNLANSNVSENKYRNALYYTQKAINYSKANQKTEAHSNQNFRLGKLYFEVKKYDDAIKAFNKSISLSNVLQPSSESAYSYYHLGLCYLKKKDFSKAKISFDKAQLLFDNLKITNTVDLINLQRGIINKSTGNLDLAASIFNTIVAKPDSPAILDTKASALYQVGTIEMAQNRNNLALNYFEKALDLNAKNKNLEQKATILLALSTVYEKMLDKNNAYTYLKQYTNLKESISLLDNEKLGIDDYEKFKESERLAEVARTNKENIQKEKTNKFSKLISILAIALISILSLLSLSLYKNNIIRTRSNLLLKGKNKELILAKEKAEKASNARSEFLSTVSHELRTPLNAINGIAHLLLEERPKKSQMHYLESLQFSGNYLTNFINDILEINKIDSNKAQIENTTFNLKVLLEKTQSSLKELALENNNNFSFKIDSGIPDYLIGDPTKLSQILMNLINNALKFTHDGYVMVTANLVSLEDKKARIFFEVKDNGIGIPEDKLETVFDSFSQGSVDINRKYGGTGLGLTIVKKLVSILGGEIQLESIVKEGSTFTFELPFKVSEKPSKADRKPKKINDTNLIDKKILVVEDNKINQMISKKMLENKGIHCEIIDNGEDAIEVVKNHKFDMILMDVHLPGINGTVATKKIREFDKTTPIIALTAISLNENRKMLLSYGMNDVVTKPFIPEDFYATISKHI
ncbi:tetratricopeptide repeat-containing hybrid sensor histidine kinase/response regulator [Flavobacterium limnophilum]|uniref:tetratricopeptide repeat-containing hybrid sensor histidine kinase/response regulator n=1 Tax=Flavobacterium limnophilum TaxID=3003262 RepID=UPI002482684D|nr:ATP-binding protein [Flavobacterium limnophilum]